jgi:hypothetical protein
LEKTIKESNSPRIPSYPKLKNYSNKLNNNMPAIRSSSSFFQRYSAIQKSGDIYTRILNAPARQYKEICNNNLSDAVLTKQTRTGINRTVESVEARRARRDLYISAVCELVKRVNNNGFTLADFKSILEEKNIQHITLYRHNDLVETFTAIAYKFGIVFFRDTKDNYYVDNCHALVWGLKLRPTETEIAAGAGRGIKQMTRKGEYTITEKAERRLMKAYGRVQIDYDVMAFVKA